VGKSIENLPLAVEHVSLVSELSLILNVVVGLTI